MTINRSIEGMKTMTAPDANRKALTSIATVEILHAILNKVQGDTIDATLTAMVEALRFDPQVYNAQVAMQHWIDTCPHTIDEVIPTADTYIAKD